MRLTQHLWKVKARQEPVEFQEILPLKLRQTVSSKGDKTSEVSCIQEMTVLMACLKLNEFDERLCPKEITAFQSCYKSSEANRYAEKERMHKGILIPKERKMSHRQLNKLLRQFPNLE